MRLFHKELEAYVVAEGLFEDDITEDGEYNILYLCTNTMILDSGGTAVRPAS